jgi:hypothetical protein
VCGQWQAIETVEKDGDWKLGWAPGWMPVMMAWVSLPDRGVAGWYVGDGKYINPTHWMPMPAAPDFQNEPEST